MKFVSTKPLSLLAASLLMSSMSHAALIDFTDRSMWGTSGSGAVTKDYDGMQVTLQAFNAAGATSYTNTAFDGLDRSVCGSLACQSDGIGIAGDEVTFGLERLSVTFSEAVNVQSIWVLDLFGAMGGDSAGAEVFQVAANGLGGEWASWIGTDMGGGGGLFTATLDNATALSTGTMFTSVWSLDFFVHDLGAFIVPANSDFALGGLEVTSVSVPEPGTLGLLTLGLLGALGATRRRNATRS